MLPHPNRENRNQQKKESQKLTKICRLNKALLNNQWLTDKGRNKIKELLESEDSARTRNQNTWDMMKEVETCKFIAMDAYIRKMQQSQII